MGALKVNLLHSHSTASLPSISLFGEHLQSLCYSLAPEGCSNPSGPWTSAPGKQVQVLVSQSCPTLHEPMDRSPPGSSIYGIFQARILAWVAISFSRWSSPPRDWTWVSHNAGSIRATREANWAQTQYALERLHLEYKLLIDGSDNTLLQTAITFLVDYLLLQSPNHILCLCLDCPTVSFQNTSDSSVAVVQSLSCVRLCDTMDCSTPGFPVLHYLLEFAQTHVHRIDDAIQPSYPLLPPSPPILNLLQHQGLLY